MNESRPVLASILLLGPQIIMLVMLFIGAGIQAILRRVKPHD